MQVVIGIQFLDYATENKCIWESPCCDGFNLVDFYLCKGRFPKAGRYADLTLDREIRHLDSKTECNGVVCRRMTHPTLNPVGLETAL